MTQVTYRAMVLSLCAALCALWIFVVTAAPARANMPCEHPNLAPSVPMDGAVVCPSVHSGGGSGDDLGSGTGPGSTVAPPPADEESEPEGGPEGGGGMSSFTPYFLEFLPPATATVGETYSYQFRAHDINHDDEITFSLVVSPDGMTITPSGYAEWIPTGSQGGVVYDVRVAITDGENIDARYYQITVLHSETEAPASPSALTPSGESEDSSGTGVEGIVAEEGGDEEPAEAFSSETREESAVEIATQENRKVLGIERDLALAALIAAGNFGGLSFLETWQAHSTFVAILIVLFLGFIVLLLAMMRRRRVEDESRLQA